MTFLQTSLGRSHWVIMNHIDLDMLHNNKEMRVFVIISIAVIMLNFLVVGDTWLVLEE